MTSTTGSELQVADNPAKRCYEAFLDGVRIGRADYALREAAMVIPHTEIDPRYGGRGFGGQMVRHVLDDARTRGLRIVPACPFVGDYIRRNPEYADLL